MSPWAHKILDDKGEIVLITTALPNGGEAFYYLLLSRMNHSALEKALQGTQEIRLESFGRIVRSGWGIPDEADRAFMRKHYQAQA